MFKYRVVLFGRVKFGLIFRCRVQGSELENTHLKFRALTLFRVQGSQDPFERRHRA